MKTDNNFVRSGRKRLENDDYQTVDHRCIDALVETIKLQGTCVDVCSPNGSGIIQRLIEKNYKAFGINDAFTDVVFADWIVSNPPYKRNIVDKIICRQLQRIVDNQVIGVAMLLRTAFDHAKTRKNMFVNNQYYAGQIKMLFRPKWFEDGDKTPIHNYVWHIWAKNWVGNYPRVWYWSETGV